MFPLLTSVLYDESEWETPHTFNPSHFLDEEGKFVRRDAFMPFSAGTTTLSSFCILVITHFSQLHAQFNSFFLAGRRVCLGLSLARMELFLFFTSLLQRFRFTPPPGVSEDELDLTPVVGFTLSPPAYELCAVSRQ